MHKDAQFGLDHLDFRAPTVDDAQRVHELIARCEVHDYGEPDTELSDLTFDWDRVSLTQDAWLVVMRWRTELEYAIYVDPSWAELDLDRAILARCEARGQAVARACNQDLVARCYLPHANRRKHEIVEDVGFRLVKYHFQMGIRLDEPPPAPTWPAGVAVRTAVPEQEGRAIHRLVETAFARPGRTATTYEEWTHLMMRDDILDPDLWFLAVAGEELAGACLSFAYPDIGWVRQLAVAEAWRRKGIGTALLRHAFGVFRERGHVRAGLAVDGENPNAYAFYEQVGMQRVRQHDEYARVVASYE
jgi:mycothiol synthase